MKKITIEQLRLTRPIEFAEENNTLDTLETLRPLLLTSDGEVVTQDNIIVVDSELVVLSIFGRTGVVTAEIGDYNTSQVTESTNLRYVTDLDLVHLANLNGINTGDETYSSIIAKLGYVPEDSANKELTTLDNSNIKFPTNKVVKDYIDAVTGGAIILQGDWNAATNTPDISDTTQTGFAWRVSVDGNTNLGGITDWTVNDLAIKTSTGWIKVDNQDIYAVWGNIGGDINNQTDLIAALDTKVTKNPAIIGGTYSKITYDSKGLVIAGEVLTHNEVTDKQGGKPGEYYHLTAEQLDRVLNTVYQVSINTVSINTPVTALGEKGVNTNVILQYSILAHDDIITSADIDGIPIIYDGATHTLDMGIESVTTTYTMTVNFTRNAVPMNEIKTVNYTGAVPQYRGVTPVLDFASYNAIELEVTTGKLVKAIQTSPIVTNITNPSNEFIWFISNKPNAIIRDSNSGLSYTIGAWDNGITEFYTKSLTTTLANSVDSTTLYLYRTRLPKTFSNFTYYIS